MRFKGRALFILVLAVFILVNSVALASTGVIDTAREEAIKKALTYLSGLQNSDGGFANETGRMSSQNLTAWVIMALKAAGEDVHAGQWIKGGHSPLDYLLAAEDGLQGTTDYARVVLALTGAGQKPLLGGVDLAERIISFQQADGQFAQVGKGEKDLLNTHLWSILALKAAGREIPQKDLAKNWIVRCQNKDGGFGWAKGLESDPDDTGIAINALLLLGEKADSPALRKAVSYLAGQQDEEGGFHWLGQESNTATDAWVIQSLIAAGENPTQAVHHLLSLQNKDGSFNWTKKTKSSPGLMTAYALLALSGKPLPVTHDYHEEKMRISLTVDKKETRVNGEIKMLDVPPAIIQGRTMVPIRFIGEYLGAGFQWLEATREVAVTYQGQKFSLFVGKTAPDLDVPPVLVEGRVLVPLRYIAEKLGASITWLEKERRVEIEK